MRYEDPGPTALWLLLAPAAVVIGAWIVLTLARIRQRTFWVVAVPAWLAFAAIALGGILGVDSVLPAVTVLVSWAAALLLLFPVSVVVSDRRSTGS